MIKNSTFTLALFFLVFISLSFAECSVTSLTTSAVSAAQIGNSVTVTVTYSGSGCSGQQLYLDTSGGLTVDPTSKTLGTDSGSETFSLSASVAGSYTYNARLSTTTSTSATIQFVSPSVLTVDSSSNPSSISDRNINSAFTLTVVINNPSAAEITSSYSLTYDSSMLSISSTSGSITIGAGESTTLTWSVTPTTYFSSKSILFNLGSTSGAFTCAVSTVSQPSSDSGSSTKKSTTTSGTNQTTTPTSNTSSSTTTSSSTGSDTSTTSAISAETTTSTETNEVVDSAKTDALNSLSSADSAISAAAKTGKDVSAAKAKLNAANEALATGDYALAKTLAAEAENLAKNAKAASTTPVTQPTTTKPTTQPQQGMDMGAILLILVVIIVIVVGIYYLTKGKSSKGFKGQRRV